MPVNNKYTKPRKRSFDYEREYKFVNRDSFIQIFSEKLSSASKLDDPDLLVFHGIGGQGKTALADHLLEISETPDSHNTLNNCIKVDLSNISNDPEAFLIRIRNKFADKGVDFPVFDLAVVAYWSDTRPEQPLPVLTRPFYGNKTKFAEILAGGIGGMLGFPFAGDILKKGVSIVAGRSKKSLLERSRPHLIRLKKNDAIIPSAAIKDLFPYLLAQDINLWLDTQTKDTSKPHIKNSILFDEYERLFKSFKSIKTESSAMIEDYIKELVVELENTLVVIFSREIIDWVKAWENPLRKSHYSLNGLQKRNAIELIHNANIKDSHIIDIILFNSREDDNTESTVYFPMLIDLQLNNITNMLNTGKKLDEKYLSLQYLTVEQRTFELVDRLMRDYDLGVREALERLSYCNEFDQDLFEAINKEFNTGLNRRDFKKFCNISIIKETDGGTLEVVHVVSEILQRNHKDDFKFETHAFLLSHHEQRARVPDNLKFSPQNLHHLFLASDYKLHLDFKSYYYWLIEWAPHLLKQGYLSQGLNLFQMGFYEYKENNGSDSELISKYRLIIACYYCGLGKHESCKKLISKNSIAGYNLKSIDISHLIRYSCDQKTADYWFDRLYIPILRPLTSNTKFFIARVLNAAIDKAKSAESAEKYKKLVVELEIEKDSYTLNAIVKKLENFDEAFTLIKTEDSSNLSTYSYGLLFDKSNSLQNVSRVLNLMRNNNIKISVIHYNNLVHNYGKQDVEKAIKQAGHSIDHIEKNLITYTSYIGNTETYDSALDIYTSMKRHNIAPDGHCISTVLSKAENMGHVLDILDEVIKYNLAIEHYYWNNIAKHVVSLDDFNRLLEKYYQLSDELSKGLFSKIVSNLVDHKNEQRKKIFYELIDTVKEPKLWLTLIEQMICAEENHKQIDYLLELLDKNKLDPNINIINHSIEISDSFEVAIDWLIFCQTKEISVSKNTLIKASACIYELENANVFLKYVQENRLEITYVMLLGIVNRSSNEYDQVFEWLHNLLNCDYINKSEVIITLFLYAEDNENISKFRESIFTLNVTLTNELLIALISREKKFKEALLWVEAYSDNRFFSHITPKLATKISTFDDADLLISRCKTANVKPSMTCLQATTKRLCETFSAEDVIHWFTNNFNDISLIAKVVPPAIKVYSKKNNIPDAIKFSLLNPVSPTARKFYRENIEESEKLLLNNEFNGYQINVEIALLSLYLEIQRDERSLSIRSKLETYPDIDLYREFLNELDVSIPEKTD